MPAYRFVPQADHLVATSPSEQLNQELKDDLSRALDTGRPILTHLNADTTWLLSLAYPPASAPPPGRSRFNILFDPWLKGPQSDYYAWFSTQSHAIESSVQTIQELENLLRDIESYKSTPNSATSACEGVTASGEFQPPTLIDVVIVSHEFTDHCHEATLREVPHTVPVFATSKAAGVIKAWTHFDSVYQVPPLESGSGWRQTSQRPLPSWIGISRLITKSDALYYHSAVIVCIQSPFAPEEADAVVYTPHGVESDAFALLRDTSPPIHTLALLHGLHDISLNMMKQLNLGAHNALKAQRILSSKYWIGTHDEVKHGSGLIGRLLLKRKQLTVDDALKRERGQKDFQKVLGAESITVPKFFDLKSGESMVLE